MRVNIPNLLTLARILLVPVAIWLIISNAYAAAFFVLVAAGVTDALDGFLAKRFGWTTQLGAYLDPLADKLLLVSTFIALGLQLLLPAWLVIMVVTRDILIVSAVLLSAVIGENLEVRPVAISKLNTVVQIALALLILAGAGFSFDWQIAQMVATYATALLTVASAGVYLWGWLQRMTGSAPPDGGT
jgi:cardiolipin synthase (CMP-forming)